MDKQIIISVGREYGSGGHEIAEKLAERFDLPLYDYNLLHEIAVEKNANAKELAKYDELPRSRFLTRTVRGYSNSLQENVAKMQFDYLKKKAARGDSFVIVGRCSEMVLMGCEGLITFFILGDMEKKVERIARIHQISKSEAEKRIYYYNAKRKEYHNYFCSVKWGDSRNYELSVNSSKLGIEATTNLLERYIRERIG